MVSARWEAWAIARCINERDLVFEPSNGKHLYSTGSGNNYMLNPQREEKKQVTETPFFFKESEPNDLNSKKHFSL